MPRNTNNGQANAQLQRELAFRRAMEEAIPSGIIAVDLNGKHLYVNPVFCAMVGWKEKELLAAREPFPYWPPEEEQKIRMAFLRALDGHAESGGFHLRFRRRRGEPFDALVQPKPLNDPSGALIGWVAAVTDISQEKWAEEALHRAHNEMEMVVRERTADLTAALTELQATVAERERLEHELLEITERERRRTSMELHNDVGQILTGLALMAKGLELKLRRSNVAEATEATLLHANIQRAIGSSNGLPQNLHAPESESSDVVKAMFVLRTHVQNQLKVSCKVEAHQMLPAVSKSVVRQLYEIAQEAVINAIKHGHARMIRIGLAHKKGDLVLTVRSDGTPFPDLQSHRAGVGLRLMRYRAHLIGASLEVRSAGIEGTIVACSLRPAGATPSKSLTAEQFQVLLAENKALQQQHRQLVADLKSSKSELERTRKKTNLPRASQTRANQ